MSAATASPAAVLARLVSDVNAKISAPCATASEVYATDGRVLVAIPNLGGAVPVSKPAEFPLKDCRKFIVKARAPKPVGIASVEDLLARLDTIAPVFSACEGCGLPFEKCEGEDNSCGVVELTRGRNTLVKLYGVAPWLTKPETEIAPGTSVGQVAAHYAGVALQALSDLGVTSVEVVGSTHMQGRGHTAASAIAFRGPGGEIAIVMEYVL
jgi:hypothetical protein